MSLFPASADASDGGVENLAFEILMESVLKMSTLMNVSVFVLVEQKRGQKRRYGGSSDLCNAYKKGILKAQTRDVQMTVVEDEGLSPSQPGADAGYEIVETEEIVGEGRERSFPENISGRGEGEDPDYVGEIEDFDDDDDDDADDPDWLVKQPKKHMPQRQQKQTHHRSKTKKKHKRATSSEESESDDENDDNVRKVVAAAISSTLSSTSTTTSSQEPTEGELFARQIRDYAEGRCNLEDSWDVDVSQFMGVQRVVVGGVVEAEAASGVVNEVVTDDGARDDSSEDDEWKPVNYGKGKLFQREKKKYFRKEVKRRTRLSGGGFNDNDGEGSEYDGSVTTTTTMKSQASSYSPVVGGGVAFDKKINYDGGKCPYCKTFFHKLKQHVQDVHESERKYSCEYCATRFKRDEHLKKHLKSVHKVT